MQDSYFPLLGLLLQGLQGKKDLLVLALGRKEDAVNDALAIGAHLVDLSLEVPGGFRPC